MIDIISLGEVCVEFYAEEPSDLTKPVTFKGPFPSGVPCIYLAQIAGLGLSGGIIGCVGDDMFGVLLKRAIYEKKIDTTFLLTCKSKSTGMGFCAYDINQLRHFVLFFNGTAVTEIETQKIPYNYINKARLAHITGSWMCINEKTIDSTMIFANIAKKNKLLISFDANLRKEIRPIAESVDIVSNLFPLIDIICTSEEEATWLTGYLNFKDAGKKLLDLGIKIVVIRRGEDGCLILNDKNIYEVSAFEVLSVNSTGAGDVHAASVDYGILKNWDIKKIATYANAAAAVAIKKLGAMSVGSKIEIDNFLKTGKKKC